MPLAAIPENTDIPDSATGGTLDVAATLASQFSGSTLFAILLARHSQLCSDGETFPVGDLNSAQCSCGLAQIDCPYYREAGAHFLSPDGKSWDSDRFVPQPAYSRWRLLDAAAGRLWGNRALRLAQAGLRSIVPQWRRQDQAFVAAHWRFMENSLRLKQAKVYVDGTKSLRRAVLFARLPTCRLKVIHLIRDGRGFCFSYLKNWDLPPSSLTVPIRGWARNIVMIDRFRALWPHVPILDIRYEDLCQDLPGTMTQVCQFLGVPYEPALESSDALACHVLGNKMRLAFRGQVQQCLRWQRELAPWQIEEINRALGRSLERFGYSIAGGTKQ